MPSDFVHLHVHSHYSLLDGACTIPGLTALCKEYDMPAMALTDHGYMGGCYEFQTTFAKEGLNPILGFEAYIAPGSRRETSQTVEDVRGFHLVLLAENVKGYHNLCKLISEAFRTGMYYKPRIDMELLREYHEGVIGLSACIGGQIPAYLLRGDHARAEKALFDYLDIFGRDNFFVEIMDHKMEEEARANKLLIELARKNQVGLVATNDAHYLKRDHAKAHEIMLCIQTRSLLSEPNHFRFPTSEFYFKSPDEMKELFREVPEAVTNTRMIADRCTSELKYANHYPDFQLPTSSMTKLEYLRGICMDNIPKRYHFDPRGDNLTEDQQKLLARMDYELGIIDGSKYCAYFLVVSDFIRHAKEQGIPVGPGRGSGAGSLVAYLSLITDIDPLRYNLLFERFLNPERVSPPDFDIDFCEQRRGEVIDYVRKKYGEDSVAQICTYGALKAKAVIKDVARVLGHDFEHGDRLSKLIPEEPKMTLKKALEASSELRNLVAGETWAAEVFEYAKVIEGLNRQLGIHAAGVIIGDQRLDNLVPLARGAKGEIITEYTSVPCESLGLLKMDFLGLRTLTIIRNALDLIEANHHVKLDTSELPLDDQKTFDLLRRGDTVAVFQLESTGMQNLCRSFGVDTIEHIIALLAIYRPGPMQFIPQFIDCKRGRKEIEYDHPKMIPILAETYGIMLYQEQIMQVVQALAGFSLGGADILRRAIGKKKLDVMAAQKSKFVEGCAKCSNIDAKTADAIWSKIETFAGYGFNKSHSAAYAMVSYHTAYLKANYPVEFMAAVLTSELANAEEIAFLINACRDMKIKVLPPSVNSSLINFGVDSGSIRFGLGAIKGVGEAAAGRILESRRSDGPYSSFLDFCERCGSAVNSRMLEKLARSGAFDALGMRRSQILAIAEPMSIYAAGRARDREIGQGSLFDLLGGDDGGGDESFSVPIPDIPEFDMEEILKDEKELLGFYVTSHPMAPFEGILKPMTSHKLREVGSLPDGAVIRIGGMVSSYTIKYSKRTNKPFGVLMFEDMDTTMECSLFERTVNELRERELIPEPGMPLLLEVSVGKRSEDEAPRLSVEKVFTLQDAMVEFAREMFVYLYEERCDRELLESIVRAARDFPGAIPLVVCPITGDDRVIFIESSIRVAPCVELFQRLTGLLGNDCVRLKTAEFHMSIKPRWKPKSEAAAGANH